MDVGFTVVTFAERQCYRCPAPDALPPLQEARLRNKEPPAPPDGLSVKRIVIETL
jgi:hypothetical protein